MDTKMVCGVDFGDEDSQRNKTTFIYARTLKWSEINCEWYKSKRPTVFLIQTESTYVILNLKTYRSFKCLIILFTFLSQSDCTILVIHVYYWLEGDYRDYKIASSNYM